MGKLKLFFILLILIISLPIGYGFDIYAVPSYRIEMGPIKLSQEMKGSDLELDLALGFTVLENYTWYNKNLSLYFKPYESITSDPIKILNITVCKGGAGGLDYNYDEVYIYCEEEIPIYKEVSKEFSRGYLFKNKLKSQTYYEYKFTFQPEDNTAYVVRLTVIYRNYAQKQGDLYIVPLRYPERYKNIGNYFVFPSIDSIPQFIPTNVVQIKQSIYDKANTYYYKLVFEFRDFNNSIIFYSDYEEFKNHERWLVFLGAIWGFGFSLILLILELIFGGTWRYHLRRYYNRLFHRLNVIGNSNTKVYHLQNCSYIDNIGRGNIRNFNNIRHAQNNGYIPCNLCRPND